MKYHRILLKLSGEALMDPIVMESILKELGNMQKKLNNFTKRESKLLLLSVGAIFLEV